jgi:TRAP-type mannitol/chloroaromatic compound transport system substrate-binding protein
MAQRLAAAFEGRYRIRLEPANEADALHLEDGAPDLFFGPGDASADVAPGMAYFTGLPGALGLDPRALHGWLAVGGGQMLWDDLAAGHGFKPLLAGHAGRPGLWAGGPLTTLDGARIGIGQSRADVAYAAGAEPIQGSAASLRDGLAEGRLAAVEWGNPLAALALGFDRAASHYCPAGLNGSGSALVLSVRRAVWDAMSAGDRAILEAIAAQGWSLSLAETLGHESLVEQLLQTRPALTVGTLPREVVARWEAAAAAFVDSLVETSLEIARIHHSYRAWRRQLGLDRADGLSAPQA